MPDQKGIASGRAQIALEFVIVYSFVLVLFVLMFTLISTQRAATMSQQEYSLLQLQSQNIADYIDQAIGAGSGYAATIPLAGSIGAQQFNISISTTGVVIAQTKVGSQIIRAFAFSNARNLLINGTPTQSGNGITVYLVPIQSGSVSLANSNGAIYVDQQPPPTLTLVKSLAATQVASTRAASLNGQTGSYISLPTISPLEPTRVTLSMWFYESSVWPSNYVENGCTGLACYDMIIDHGYVDWNILSGGRYQISYTPISAGNWYFLTGTFDGSNMHFYVNGKEVSGSPISATLSYSSPSFAIGKPAAGSVSPYSISNVQIYNIALTANQIASLYASGISGTPIAPANTVGWWPLNGNTKDYGGYNDTGSPSNMGYISVAQINTQVQYGTGANAISAPLGFVTSIGILGTMGSKQVLYTNATGRQTAFISSNGFNGIANLTISAFNDNLTTVGNLIAWYPLNEGYGSVVHDLSGKYAEGGFISPVWATFANQTNLAAASFDGATSYIRTSTNSLLGGSNAISVFAWIYSNAISGESEVYCLGGATNGNACLGITSNKLYFDNDGANQGTSGLSVLANTWNFAGYTYVAGSSTITFYLNGVSNTLTLGSPPLNTYTQNSIMGAYSTYSAGSFPHKFQGSIVDLQVYNTALSPLQAMQLYQEGISGSPVGDAGLSGWWPLTYSPNDYSNNMNNGIPTNVVYNNINYMPPAKTGTTKVPYFNGANSCILTTTASITANSETQIAWVYLQSLPSLGSYAQITYQTAGIGGLYVDSGGYPLFGATLGSTFNAVGLPVSMGVNQWHMLSGTYSGSAISICMDAMTCLTTPASGALASSAYALYIGSLQGSSRFTNGEIADVQVYNSALTQTQIQQAYQQGLPPYSKLNISLG
jgi:Concanavalin A-like lectin/glucanases superfamily